MTITVCHISTTFVSKAGSARRTYRILRALRDAGYRTVNITGAAFEPSPDWDMGGIETTVIPSLHKSVSPRLDMLSFWRLQWILRSVKPDIVQTHLAKAGILGRSAAKLCKVPHVLHTVHGPTFPDSIGRKQAWLYRTLERCAASWTDRFVFVGEELRRQYIEGGVVGEWNSEIIQTGRPAAEFAAVDALSAAELMACRTAWETPSDAFVLACVGRLVPGKDQIRAIDALKALHERGIKAFLWLIGEAHLPTEQDYRARLVDHIAALDLGAFVRLMGFQPDVLKLMATADAVLMTSRYEGLPNVAVEAGIAGRPLVAFRVSGLGETIEEGATGYVLNQDDMGGLVNRLEKLARQPDLVRKMGRAARQQIRTCFSAEAMVASKLALYRRLVQSEELAAKQTLKQAPSSI